MPDEESRHFKVQCLNGRHQRKCGGHKRESSVALPGEISHLAIQHPGEDEGGAEGCPWMGANSDPQDQRLLELVVESCNMKLAWKRIRGNKGSEGVDGSRTIEDTGLFLRSEWPRIRQSLLDETYQPYPVRRVEIPKPGGGVRKLGIPTVLDRLIQQAICQILNPIFDPGFSDSSYGFRPGRNAHDAVRKAREYQQEGKQWVVDLDLKQFFDEVNHDVLMSRLGRKVKDKRLKRLINGYLKSGVMLFSEGLKATEKGTPQGGPLSPLLSNILLDDLDKELERRGHSFCRYADDCNIYVQTRIAGERVMRSITEYFEETLKLKVNHEKSALARPWKRKFLGFSFLKVFGVIMETLPAVTVKRFRSSLKMLFHEGRGRNVARFIRERLNPALRGWFQYFSAGISWKLITTLDFWIRRRLRCMIWRQWKRPGTRMWRLIGLGISQGKARFALNHKGPWWNSGTPVLTQAFSPSFFQSLELFNFADNLRLKQKTFDYCAFIFQRVKTRSPESSNWRLRFSVSKPAKNPNWPVPGMYSG